MRILLFCLFGFLLTSCEPRVSQVGTGYVYHLGQGDDYAVFADSTTVVFHLEKGELFRIDHRINRCE